jgi:50S ribosomal subunit-associated GTPase HflX
MPSTHNHSSGTPTVSSAGYPDLRNAGKTDLLAALAAESEAAVDRLVASIDWDAHDAAVAELAAQSDAALHHLALLEQEAEHAAGVVSAVHDGTGDITT